MYFELKNLRDTRNGNCYGNYRDKPEETIQDRKQRETQACEMKIGREIEPLNNEYANSQRQSRNHEKLASNSKNIKTLYG